MSDADDPQLRTVELAPGVEVAELLVRAFGFKVGGGGRWSIVVDSSSGRPMLTHFEITFPNGVPVDELPTIDLPEPECPLTALHRFAKYAIGEDAAHRHAIRRSGSNVAIVSDRADWQGLPGVVDPAAVNRQRRTARESTTNRGGRPRVSDAMKLAVLEAYEAAGPEGSPDRLTAARATARRLRGTQHDLSERQLRKYLTDARKLRADQKGGE